MGRVRREKVLVIGDDEITVREISVAQLLALKETDLDRKIIEEFIQDGLGCSLDDLCKLYPSELESIWAGFTKVNDFFFKTAKLFGVEALLPNLSMMLGEIFGKEFVVLLMQDTPEP